MIGPGDKVVCVDDTVYGDPDTWPLRHGEIYTVKEVSCVDDYFNSYYHPRGADGVCVELFEINNPLDPVNNSYAACRFRKLDISQFRDMARSAGKLPLYERAVERVREDILKSIKEHFQ